MLMHVWALEEAEPTQLHPPPSNSHFENFGHTFCSMKFPTDINGVSSNSRNSILFFSLLPKTLSFSSSPSSPPPNSGDALVSAAVSILKHHRSKSRWSHLRSLLATTKTTPSQFSDISLKLRNNPHLVLRFFHFTLHHSLSSHSLSSYATVVHILSRSRRKSQALDVIKSAMCAFSEAAVAILEALIKTYRACDSAPFVFDLLIIACLESKKIDRAVEIYSVLKSKNVLLKTSTCNSLIELVSKSRGCFAGYDLYRDILDRNEICGKGNFPNANTLNVVMIGFYREGFINKVEELWEEFIRIGCAPNVYSFNVLMAAYCDGGKLEYVMRVWREMKDKGLNYDVVTYNTVIGGFCRAGEVLRAEEIYGEMVMKGVESTCITFEHLINGYCKIGGHDSAMMVYMDMCRKNFNPESSTVNVMIRSLCDKDEISTAIEFWRLAVKRNGAVLEKGNYLNLIRGLCRDGNMEEALKLQAEMAVRGFEPDSEIYDAFIDGYVKDGNEMMASKLRKEMICKRTTSLL